MLRWDQPGVPHKGWQCVDVNDLGEAIGTCQMCGNTGLRYMHTMMHEHHHSVDVGSVCAPRMEIGYDAKAEERHLLNRSARRARWLNRKWKKSHKGGHYVRDSNYIAVLTHAGGKQYRLSVGRKSDREADDMLWQKSQRGSFESLDAAKMALFDYKEALVKNPV